MRLCLFLRIPFITDKLRWQLLQLPNSHTHSCTQTHGKLYYLIWLEQDGWRAFNNWQLRSRWLPFWERVLPFFLSLAPFLRFHFHFRCVCVLSICERDKGSGRKHEQVGPWRIVPTKMLFFTLFERKLSDSRTPKKQRQQEHQAAQEEKVVSSK